MTIAAAHRPAPAAAAVRRASASAYLAVGLLTAAAAALRFSTLGLQSYWYDEAITVEHVRAPFGEMLSVIARHEATPPLYDLLAWPWARAFGDGEVALRALSALFGTATVPVAFAAGAALVSRRAGLVAAALVAASPLLVWYSQEARAYALLTFLAAVSVLLLARALDGDRRAPALWAGVAALALATHYFAAFLVAAEAAWLLADRRTRRHSAAPVAAVAAVGAALVPLLLHQGVGQTAWVHWLSLRARVHDVFQQFATGAYPTSHPVLLGVVLLALGVAGAAVLCSRRERRGAAVAIALAGAAVALPLLVTLASDRIVDGRGDVFYYRYLLPAWPPLAVAAGAVLGARRAGRAGLAAAAVLVAVLVAADVQTFRRHGLQRDDWRAAVRALGPARTDRAIVVEPRIDEAVIRLYRGGLEPAAPAARVRELVLLARPAPGFSPSAAERPDGFALVEQRRIQHFTLLRFEAPAGRRLAAALRRVARPSLGWSILLERRTAAGRSHP